MFKKFFGAASTIAAFLIVTSLFATAAAPGDFLYQYKVHVNDRVSSWFAVEYVKDVDNQIDMIEDRLAEIDTLIASGDMTPEQAVKLRTNLLSQIESATRIISDTDSVTLTATQVKQLRDGLDRMKDALARYSTTLTSLDDIASDTPTAQKKKGGGKRTYDSIADVVEAIEDEIIEAIEEINEDPNTVATTTEEVIDDTTSTTTNETVDVDTDNPPVGNDVPDETVSDDDPIDIVDDTVVDDTTDQNDNSTSTVETQN